MSAVKGLGFILAVSACCFGAMGERAKDIQQQIDDLNALVKHHGGYEHIDKTMAPVRDEVMRAAETQLKQGRFEVGGQRFFKPITVSSVLANWDLKEPPPEGMHSPIDVIIDFDRQLKKLGVDLIMVPVPGKVEAYPELFGVKSPKGMPVSTGRIHKMLKLLEADVEVLDILPEFLELKAAQELPVFEISGHHPSGIGVRTAAELVNKRLSRYKFKDADLSRFKEDKRTATERVDRSVPMTAWQVMYSDDSDYNHVDDGQIIVTGDSHAFAFGGASWASHIARLSGVPISDLSTSGGGSTGHLRLAGLGSGGLSETKVVVWIFTSSNLERFPWRKETIGKDPSLAGLFSLGRIDAGLKAIESFRAKNPGESPNLSENEINNLGYRELGNDKCDNAIALFKINTELFPESANTFDSLGEAYANCDRREDAIASFKKALSLAPPENTRVNSMKFLKEFGVEYTPELPTLTAAQMEKLVGVYHLDQEMKGRVFVDGDKLMMDVKNRPTMTLTPITEQLFGTDIGARIRFIAGKDGGMDMKVNVGNDELNGARVEGAAF